MRRAGGQWEPGSRRWMIEQRRIGHVIRVKDFVELDKLR